MNRVSYKIYLLFICLLLQSCGSFVIETTKKTDCAAEGYTDVGQTVFNSKSVGSSFNGGLTTINTQSTGTACGVPKTDYEKCIIQKIQDPAKKVVENNKMSKYIRRRVAFMWAMVVTIPIAIPYGIYHQSKSGLLMKNEVPIIESGYKYCEKYLDKKIY